MGLFARAVEALLTRLPGGRPRQRCTYAGHYPSFAAVPATGYPWTSSYLEVAAAKVAQLRDFGRAGRFSPANYQGQSDDVVLAAAGGCCRVLDFGGAYGWLYYCVKDACPALFRSRWLVVNNEQAIAVGRSLGAGEPGLEFAPALPEAAAFDVVFFCSVLEYIEDWEAVLARALDSAPRFVMVAKAHACVGGTFITAQRLGEVTTPVRFFDIDALIAAFTARGYRLDFQAASAVKALAFSAGVPGNCQAVGSFILIFPNRAA